MKIIEEKQAVLRPYRTGADCVLPHRGRNVQPLEPMSCPVTELSTAEYTPESISDAETREPVEYTPRRVSDIELQKPVDCVPRRVLDVGVQKPVECVPRRVSDVCVQKPMDCIPRKISDMGLQEPVECITESISAFVEQPSHTAVQAPVKCIPQSASERTLQPARAQVIPASPEWGQVLEETMSGRKKRKWLAETIQHMTDSQ